MGRPGTTGPTAGDGPASTVLEILRILLESTQIHGFKLKKLLPLVT